MFRLYGDRIDTATLSAGLADQSAGALVGVGCPLAGMTVGTEFARLAGKTVGASGGVGVGVGVDVIVGLGVTVGVSVGVSVGVDVAVGVAVAVGVSSMRLYHTRTAAPPVCS